MVVELRHLGSVGLLLAVGVVACPGVARACLPAGGATAWVWPPPGEAVPGAGLFVIRSSCVDADPTLVASVDGLPAAVTQVDVPATPSPYQSFRLSAAAPIGSEVDVDVMATSASPFGCPVPERQAFVIGEPDNASPHAPALAVTVEPSSRPDLSCSGPAREVDTVLWTVDLDPDPSDADAVVGYGVSLVDRHGDAADRATFLSVNPRGGPVTTSFMVDRDDARGEFCVAVATIDLAGNAGEPVQTCEGVDTERLFSGCACAATPTDRTSWAWWLAVLLVGGRRRALRRPVRGAPLPHC
jgi:MYXO-CTERM domain-containing protein